MSSMPTTLKTRSIDRLGIELLEIMLSVYLLRNPAAVGEDYLSQMRSTKVVALLVNDIIVRLGKFREDDNRNWGFREVAKLLGKRTSTASHAVAAAPAIDEFMQGSKRLEDYRNLAVAHLPKRGAAHLHPLTELYRLVALAVRIVDTLAGEKNAYRFGEVDLRKEVMGDEDA